MEAVYIAIIAAVTAATSMLGPIILASLSSKQRRDEKKQDWDREDLVAAKAAEAAKLLVESQRALLVATKGTHEKLDVVHALVNSNLTTALQASYDSMSRELTMMYEIVELKRKDGAEPSDYTKSAISATEGKLKELGENLVVRAAQQAEMDARVAAEKSVLKVQQVVTDTIVVTAPAELEEGKEP